MKRYIAFHNQQNSGIIDQAKAQEWALNYLTKNMNVTKVHIAEVLLVVERAAPPIAVNEFFCQLDESA